MDYSKNVYKLYLIIFFHNLIPAYVIERLFYEQRGMTVFMVVLCEVIYAATIVLAEIPSGILADKLGRRPLLLLGAAFAALEFPILIFANRFMYFALMAVIAGLAGACTSGAQNALLYDSLLAVKKEGYFVKALGRMNALDFLAAILAALSGSVLAKFYGFELNYMLSCGSMLFALLFTFSLEEPPVRGCEKLEEAGETGFRAYLKGAVGFYRHNPKVAFMVVNAIAIGACINYLDEFWQLYLRDIGFPILFFGLFSAAVSLIRIPGNLIAGYLMGHFKEAHILMWILGTVAAGFFIAAVFPGAIGVAAIGIVFLASGVVDPLASGFLHRHADSALRATVDSFQSLGERVIILIVGMGFGYVASMASVAIGFVFLGLVCMLFLVLFIIKLNR